MSLFNKIKGNPTIESRTVKQALAHAEQTREELPYVVQVYPTDWDLCVLADEVYRLRKLLSEATKSKVILKKPTPPPSRIIRENGSPYDLGSHGGLPRIHKTRDVLR